LQLGREISAKFGMLGRRKVGARAQTSKPKKWRTEIHSSEGSDSESVLNKIDLPPSSDEDDAEVSRSRRSRSRSPRRVHNKRSRSRSLQNVEADDGQPVVPFSEVSTMPQCIRAVNDLVSRVETVSHLELFDACIACKKIGCFDADFFTHVHKVMPSHIQNSMYSVDKVIVLLAVLNALNAVNYHVFEAALELLVKNADELIDRQTEIKGLFSRTHADDVRLVEILRTKRVAAPKKVCTMYFRGQCKWGPRCKFSHDQSSFDKMASQGRWQQLPAKGSSGFQQSRNLQAPDRTGQLW
jgi:hypothetical protein